MDATLTPLVDLSRASGSVADRVALAADVDAACRATGFMQVVGHGVPERVIAGLYETATAFFDLPLDEKRRYVPADREVNRGYAELGSESLAYSIGHEAVPDLFEAFNIGLDDVPADDPYYAAERERTFAPNLWPDRPAEMRAAFVAYFDAMRVLARRLTDVMAYALDLPPDFFADRTDKSVNTLRAINYERRAGDAEPVAGQMRMGAHTDYGILTILLADPVPGLEILGPDGTWRSVVPEPGAFVVNLGDALAVWTNDRWRSTLHRVVPPPASAQGPVRRRSFAFFHDGNLDAVMEPIPSCVSAENPARYEPITLGEHLLAKILGPRAMETTTASAQTAADRYAPS